MVSRLELAVEHDLVDRIAVDRQLQRLAHPCVLPEWRLGAFTVGEIDRDPCITEPGNRRELEARVLAHSIEIRRGDTLNQVRLRFATLEEAVAFAKKRGIDYTVIEPQEPTIRPKSYADNFRYDRPS